jgi:ribosome-associated toxin RatA of RatAB toxin-antitoxin module
VADQASSSITIDADPQAVLSVIRDVTAYPDWTGGITRAEVLEEGDGGPRRVAFAISQAGLSDEYTLVYDWKPDGVAWVLEKPSKLQKSQQGSYRLTGSGGGTEVTYLLTMDVAIPMIGMLKRKFQKTITDTALKELKKRVESLR